MNRVCVHHGCQDVTTSMRAQLETNQLRPTDDIKCCSQGLFPVPCGERTWVQYLAERWSDLSQQRAHERVTAYSVLENVRPAAGFGYTQAVLLSALTPERQRELVPQIIGLSKRSAPSLNRSPHLDCQENDCSLLGSEWCVRMACNRVRRLTERLQHLG